MPFEIDVSCMHGLIGVDQDRLVSAVRHGLAAEEVANAVLSISVVDNATIHQLNREHLNHDYPTDVISFQLDWACPERSRIAPALIPSGRSKKCSIEGEVVVSAEFAAESAVLYGWSMMDELILYAVHGVLHLCGYDDLTSDEQGIMREREKAILENMGLVPHYAHGACSAEDRTMLTTAESEPQLRGESTISLPDAEDRR